MSEQSQKIDKNNLPQHIAIIMDGNGRWAKKRYLPRKAGHKEGAKVFAEISKYARKIGIKYLTVYAFSTENWKRPQNEIDSIMELLSEYLDKAFSSEEKGVRVNFIGNKTGLKQEIIEKINLIEQKNSIENYDITVNIAVNYGGREELVNTCREIVKLAKNSEIDIEDITEHTMAQFLYTKGMPDPDLVIRPSGEQRLSNFLIWQLAYAELVFMDILWPDFKSKDLDTAISIYQKRNRRFGGL